MSLSINKRQLHAFTLYINKYSQYHFFYFTILNEICDNEDQGSTQRCVNLRACYLLEIDIQIVCFRHIVNHNIIEIAIVRGLRTRCPWTCWVVFDNFAHRLDLSNRVPSWYLRLSIIQIFGVLNQTGSLLVTTISTFWARHDNVRRLWLFHHNLLTLRYH